MLKKIRQIAHYTRLQLIRARFSRRAIFQIDTQFNEDSDISNPYTKDLVVVGNNTIFMGQILILSHGAQVKIGDWCYVGPSSKIWSMNQIVVGDRVFISHGVHVFDNNSHSISASERHERFCELLNQGRHLKKENVLSRSVVIEDDAWIGFNSAILKGVRIGKGSIVGACSVVTKDVPEYTIVVGNPARAVGKSIL